MTKDPYWIKVESDLYYVYALFDENGFPFYIGKGKGPRVNNHTKPTLLKEKSHKNHKIRALLKKQGYLKRDILAYCTTEAEAYSLEESLIAHYGLRSEGGCLTNVLKSNSDFCEKALETGRKASLTTNVKITPEIAKEMVEIRNKDSSITFKQLGEMFGVSGARVCDMFCGKMATIQIETNHRPNKVMRFTKEDVDSMKTDKSSGMSVPPICKKYSISKTHLFRILNSKELKYLENA